MKFLSSPFLAATLFCGMLSFPSLAQDAPYTPTLPKERNIHASLDQPSSNDNQNHLTGTLAYQWKARRWMYLKAGVFYSNIMTDHRDDNTPVAADTLLRTSAWQEYRVGGLTLGVESRRHFFKALSLVAGVDGLFGYGPGKAIYVQQYQSGTAPFTTTYGDSRRIERDYGSMIKASFRAYTGVRITPGRHLIAGLDLGLWLHYEYLERPNGGNLFDFSLDAPAFRFMAGWRF